MDPEKTRKVNQKLKSLMKKARRKYDTETLGYKKQYYENEMAVYDSLVKKVVEQTLKNGGTELTAMQAVSGMLMFRLEAVTKILMDHMHDVQFNVLVKTSSGTGDSAGTAPRDLSGSSTPKTK